LFNGLGIHVVVGLSFLEPMIFGIYYLEFMRLSQKAHALVVSNAETRAAQFRLSPEKRKTLPNLNKSILKNIFCMMCVSNPSLDRSQKEKTVIINQLMKSKFELTFANQLVDVWPLALHENLTQGRP
jgi:hypothetical protein